MVGWCMMHVLGRAVRAVGRHVGYMNADTHGYMLTAPPTVSRYRGRIAVPCDRSVWRVGTLLIPLT